MNPLRLARIRFHLILIQGRRERSLVFGEVGKPIVKYTKRRGSKTQREQIHKYQALVLTGAYLVSEKKAETLH